MIDAILGFFNGLRNYNYVPPKLDAKVAPAEAFTIPAVTAEWKGIVWHHSATQDNPRARDWDGIRRFHMSYRVGGNIVTNAEYAKAVAAGTPHCEKPWSDIGYHLGIERTENGLEVVIGRAWNKAGAHAGFKETNEYNETYLGCCLVGNYDATPPDEETMALCLAVTRQIMDRFGVPKENVLGHRETYDKVGVPRLKTCPGSSIDLELFRSKL